MLAGSGRPNLWLILLKCKRNIFHYFKFIYIVSVKFVGVFVVMLIGFRAVADLWDILGDMSKPVVKQVINKYHAPIQTSVIVISLRLTQ